MKLLKLFLFSVFWLTCFHLGAQTSYSGFLGEYPITLITYHYSDGVSIAYYAYDKYDTPISVNGRIEKGTLNLYEKDETGHILATFRFEAFDSEAGSIRGKWISADSSDIYGIFLTKDFDLEYGDDIVWEGKELLQSASTQNHYFKAVIAKERNDFYGRVSGVKIFEKKTDRLIQTIPLDCQLMGIDSVSVGDFNFDGIEDFSVFAMSHAGPNTSSVYILKDPYSEKYTVSDFDGTSLEFDEVEKRIYEHNQCCAGTKHMNAVYKVVNNKMVLIEKTCLEYNEETNDFIEVECES